MYYLTDIFLCKYFFNAIKNKYKMKRKKNRISKNIYMKNTK